MMFQKFFESPAGKVMLLVLFAAAILIAYFNMHDASPAAASNSRWFVDAKTGKPFQVELKSNMPIPCAAPSGSQTGWPAELCYWTADGKPKTDPTPVLMNSNVGKPEPTFCPDCHRLVVGRNPPAGPGMRPPPTEAEWKAKHAAGSDDSGDR